MSILAAIRTLFTRRLPGTEIYEAAPVADNIVQLPRPVVDPRVIAIKRIAAARLSRKPVTEEMTEGLSARTQEWLSLLSTEMLLLVTSATQSQMREHIAGRRSIRGLLAADQLSIDAYKEALKPRLSIVDHDGRRGGGGGPKRSFGR
ncbi:hypothetical protein [Devosia sp. SD17-2]|jgi:hypothetical protein|uniref:hypothetical protein n=1 Tax=Devosia sp. SD17-2 TaxID=2976459 RepID=UPI0023D895FE|nr:hypothetical protein [Devosia sp. SD17-2]WEJ35110.1 hypothetical protein NYQ88_10110 [Devosia sp. SD17-2]